MHLFDEDRRKKVEALRAAGLDPWPPGPVSTEPIAGILERIEANDPPETSIGGRIRANRPHGKLAFLDVSDRTGRIQVALRRDEIGEGGWGLYRGLDLGDWVLARGRPGRTRTGEATIFASEIALLSKSLLPPPEKWHGLTDRDLRYRRRYVDLFSTEGVAESFARRARMIRAMREFLDARGYLEVETPLLHPVFGGATAKPFVTHHNALDLDLYLRIAPELYLKRLLVGGLERVYEIGRVFRNEGLSTRHNPEFTMLESYEAYADYRGIAELVESMLEAAAQAATGGTEIRFREKTYRFEVPFARTTYAQAFRERLGFDLFDEAKARDAARAREIPEKGRSAAAVANDLFEAEVEPALEGPVFVLDYPLEVCPLARRHRSDPRLAERFELFVAGMEIANAFTELNDPLDQEERFRAQVASRAEDVSREVDLDYVRALGYGMPPAGGLGVGIDRLAMLLTNSPSIRDVLLFPLLRPEARAEE